jgi:uncharacterized membrane protein YqhA
MNRLLLASRHLVVLAVVAALIGAAVVLVFGASVLLHLTIDLVKHRTFTSEAIKVTSLQFIQLIDLLFLGVALYIVALGLYHLFIDASLRLPRWLEIGDFDELKIVLISVVIIILAINFTGVVVDWDGNAAVLHLGLAVAAVIAALGLIVGVHVVSSRHPETGKPHGAGRAAPDETATPPLGTESPRQRVSS